MGYPRARIVDSSTAGFYHCISRCVRRAFLCGDMYDHRRMWIEQRLAELLEVFTIEACGYTIMSNHLHLVLKTDPKAARALTDLEVAHRWLKLYPADLQRRKQAAVSPAHARRIETAYLQSIVADHRKITRWRVRLASISWFNKMLKEPIARRANREDDCTGHFWEGRFKSIRLLDKAAVLACMVYIDLNPMRAGMARSLQECSFTSILHRLKVLRRPDGRRRKKAKRTRRARVRLTLIPINTLFGFSASQYVSLVGATGGVPTDQRDHRDTLTEMGIDADLWADTIGRTIDWIGTAVGRTRDLLKEAQRREVQRVVSAIDIYLE
jgi:REP element-mobilizing transposase RayT